MLIQALHRYLFIACCAVPFQAFAIDPPQTPAGDISDTYFGTAIADPYRWLEDMKSDAFTRWTRAQSNYADNFLSRIAGRDKLKARITALGNASESVTRLQIAGSKLFYLKLEPGRNARRLFARDAAGNETLLIDPETLPSKTGRQAIDFFSPSFDGSLLVVGLSAGGSEDSVLRILDTTNATWLPDAIDGAGLNEEGVGWKHDSRSFFYNRLPAADENGRRERYARSAVYEHVIGRPPAEDKAVIGYGVTIRRHFMQADLPLVKTSPDSDHAVAIVLHGDSVDRSIYVAPLSSVNGPATPWRKVAGPQDQVNRAYLRGHHLYLLSHKNAPRYKLLRVDVTLPELGRAKVVLPHGQHVLRDVAVARDALYVRRSDAGIGSLVRIPYDGKEPEAIPLPVDGSIRELAGDPSQPGAMIRLESWTTSPRYLRVAANETKDSGLMKPSPVSFSGIESRRVMVESHDGVMVPLSLLYKKGIQLDGSNPAILYGYGAYGISIDPAFSPLRLAWLERGGVYAVAHVRGGGEFGEEWHAGAHILNKSNTIKDFIACAEYLIRQGYTSPAKLASIGASAGGITVGGAITQRPDLFAAAHSSAGIADMLRMELTPNGVPNIAEFGTVMKRNHFAAMSAISPYHQIRDGTAYPAVILTTGINDPRVDTWQPAKFAARLQAATVSDKPVLLRVDYDAGHGIGSTKTQAISETADVWSFFLWQMAVPGFHLKK
ncbi:MAG: family peptidase [Paucimonas sp.]|nr:family peptidase [Paucimonas sp.]